jgi:hypothetical protein
VHILKDHSGSVESHDFRGDFIILSHSMDLKEEIETSLGSAMSLVLPRELIIPNTSLKRCQLGVGKTAGSRIGSWHLSSFTGTQKGRDKGLSSGTFLIRQGT